MPRPLRVFLCHASQDKALVRELYQKLHAEPWIDPWLDEEKLLPGQDWHEEIEKALEQTDVVIVFLSNKSVSQEGYVQRELKLALDVADEKVENTIFIIPLRLEDCPAPRRLRGWQYEDYFPQNRKDLAYRRLISSLEVRARNFGISYAIPKLDINVSKPTDNEEEKPRKNLTKINNQQLTKPTQKQYYRWTVVAVIILSLLILGGYVLNSLYDQLASARPTDTPVIFTATRTPTQTFTSVPSTFTPTPGIGSTLISDGVTMMYIPQGNFSMGSESSSDEKPIHAVLLDAYYIDKYEVTNAAYERCVEVNVCKPPKESGPYTRTAYYGNSEFDEYPVIYVDWDMAKTYCEWRGGRLPTEAEWEKAARGEDGRTYPWGEGIDCDKANYNFSCIGDTTKVGSYLDGVSPYGVYDMAGNVWEWVNDWYDGNYYATSPSSNPQGSTSGQYKVLRGGSWPYIETYVRSANRDRVVPASSSDILGFRCALSQP
ncbi:MAG: SUMF1/EgtB/PvdO family nonheme iron enzyme [Chloroflexi bacterium]|nr:SUMF1/EgtB/PvdO family nonheme iron enzyme [Chloroflexota bacterium]MBI3168360.1 SUMF1/EgtB/PvdO family nonheme iron enzyme [Chloroflexota bacterium]